MTYLIEIICEGLDDVNGYMISNKELAEAVIQAALAGSIPSFFKEDEGEKVEMTSEIESIVRESLTQNSVPVFGNPKLPLKYKLNLNRNPKFKEYSLRKDHVCLPSNERSLTVKEIEELTEYSLSFHRYSLSIFDLDSEEAREISKDIHMDRLKPEKFFFHNEVYKY